MTGAELILGLHLATAHFGGASAARMNDANPGLYVRLGDGPTVGLYLNSERRRSAYVGWTWQTDNRRWAITGGAVTGYAGATLSPLLVPSMRIRLGETGWAARLAYLHKPHAHGASGLHLSIERSWQ